MDWWLISSLNAALSVISIGILLISMRKMAASLRDRTALDQKLDKATQGLDQGLDRAIAALREEHQHLCAESKQIEAKIKQAILVRTQIDRSLAHLLQTRSQMKKEMAKKANPAAPNLAQSKASIEPLGKVNGKNLPVFVMRKINRAVRPDIH